MVLKQKYIRTQQNTIIVFPELLNHNDFIGFKPISAGFISITTKYCDGHYMTDCECYGKSVSLNIESMPEEDSKLAKRQILGHLSC